MWTAKYFKRSEFACKCGCGYNDISPELVAKLDAAREEAGVPFVVTSGCRCATHNKRVGGVHNETDPNKSSSHTKGFAADIAAVGQNRGKILAACEKYFSRRGVGDSYVHVDIDPAKPDAVWEY